MSHDVNYKCNAVHFVNIDEKGENNVGAENEVDKTDDVADGIDNFEL